MTTYTWTKLQSATTAQRFEDTVTRWQAGLR